MIFTTAANVALYDLLQKKGHGSERINAILSESATSSDPAYVLQYWGLTPRQASRIVKACTTPEEPHTCLLCELYPKRTT